MEKKHLGRKGERVEEDKMEVRWKKDTKGIVEKKKGGRGGGRGASRRVAAEVEEGQLRKWIKRNRMEKKA